MGYNIVTLNTKNSTLAHLVSQCAEIVAFSPHLDDVVFSMGGLLSYAASQKKPIRVYSIFTAASNIDNDNTLGMVRMGGYKTTPEYITARKAEDLEAFKAIGHVSVENLDFIDAAWRTDSSGKHIYTGIFRGQFNELDRPYIATLAETFKNLPIDQTNTAVFAPLGVGRHVDHILTREASALTFPKAIYYGDFPYMDIAPLETEFITKKGLKKADWNVENMDSKRRAMSAYKTQYKSLTAKFKMEPTHETFYL